jgi:flavin-dependent dehydrogenase
VSGTGRWLGLKVHARVESVMRADLEMRVGRLGYAGLARVEDGWVNVCGLFRRPQAAGRTPAAELLPTLIRQGGDDALAEALRAAEWRPGSLSAVAGFDFGWQPASPELPVIGDAESLIPPFTGHGMAMAFQAAEAALEPMAAWAEGDQGWDEAVRDLRDALRRKFSRRLRVAHWLHPFLLGQAGQALLYTGGRWGLVPFRLLYRLVR